MEGLVHGYDPPRQYPLPEGFGPAQEGTVVAHRDFLPLRLITFISFLEI